VQLSGLCAPAAAPLPSQVAVWRAAVHPFASLDAVDPEVAQRRGTEWCGQLKGPRRYNPIIPIRRTFSQATARGTTPRGEITTSS
jgi:hypothetical protein